MLTGCNGVVYPGDAVTTIMTREATGNWTVSWSISPGEAANAAGQLPSVGNLDFDPTIDGESSFSHAMKTKARLNFFFVAVTKGAPFKHALMTIELQSNGTWDFGDVEWRGIMIEAETADQTWCLSKLKKKSPLIRRIAVFRVDCLQVELRGQAFRLQYDSSFCFDDQQ